MKRTIFGYKAFVAENRMYHYIFNDENQCRGYCKWQFLTVPELRKKKL